ncbi:MAG: TrmB family transcriptional regulator [Candidatus Thermoplasmatota archaeon]|jgi:predicted DNA-binding transcriptional regulator|nr:TrmB family transcriptional regulator [Candidatus Thermoplasmatota archaeon]
MQEKPARLDKSLEKIVLEILKSRAKARIYVYLIGRNGAKSEQIIKGTKLHPSTVREMLSDMHYKKLIYRKKIQKDGIGKNPYMYFAIPPVELLKRYRNEMEDRLNRLARLAFSANNETYNGSVKIKIIEGPEKYEHS